MKYLFSALLLLFCISVSGQYLPASLQGKTVSMKLVHDGKYVAGHDVVSAGNRIYQLYALANFYSEEWTLQTTSTANWYRIYHVASNRYLTINATTLGIELQPLLTNGTEGLYQQFQFVAETQTNRFKIHSHLPAPGGVDNILQIANSDVNDGTSISLGANQTTGNSDNQKFDLTDLYPSPDPSSAVPSLADRFEGRQCGFIVKSNGYRLVRNTTSSGDRIFAFAQVTNFEKEFAIEYTSETGWFKIRQRSTGNYLTVPTQAIPGNDVLLQSDISTDDNYQKFKFIIQANDSTYKIHTKFSTGTGVDKVALLLEENLNGDTRIKLAANNTSTTAGADWNQQFTIRKYFPTPAQFSAGFASGPDKYLNKPIDISSKESLALLEPYVSGTDTLIRIQDSPVYGEQSEWIIYDTENKHDVRIRYAKTGQYLYLNVSDTISNPTAGKKLILKTKKDTLNDVRYHFKLTNNTSTSTNDWTINSRVGGDNFNQLYIDGDNNLAIKPSFANGSTYTKPNNFYLNLSLPAVANRIWAIVTNDKGHLVSDSGFSTTGTTLTHIAVADESALWHFVPTPDNHYWIRNELTHFYIYNNGSTANGTVLTNTADSTLPGAKWDVIRDGNCFQLQNVYSGKYMGLLNHPEDGKPVYQGALSAGGEKWILMRNTIDDPPMITTAHAGSTLLNPYNPLGQNALNNAAYLEKMMKNLGFPFEPSVHYTLILPSFISSEYSNQGISTSPYPNFVAVLRTALAYKFGWTNSQVDNAIANYKLDTVTHRTDAIFALRSFITDNLAMRSRSTWSYDEKQMVGWLERTMKGLKTNYAARIDKSWNDFLINSNPAADNDVLFSDLLYDVPDANKYVYPNYLPYTDDELTSLIEYGAVANQKNYRNPLFMEISPAASVPAGLLIGSINGYANISRNAIIAKLRNALPNENWDAELEDFAEAGAEAADEIASPIAEGGLETSAEVSAAWQSGSPEQGVAAASQGTAGAEEASTGATVSMGEIGGPVAIATIAVEILIMKAIQAAQFNHFTHRIYDRESRLNNYNEDITVIMQGNRLLDKIQLYEDLDYVLGTGTRFNNPSLNSVIFTGNGNWSEPGNWNNARVPANPIAIGTEIIINPIDTGECKINVPVTISPGGKITVKPNKKLTVTSALITPSILIQH